MLEVAKKARSESSVLASAPFNVAVASLPVHVRAGLAGVELKLEEEELRPRLKAANSLSPLPNPPPRPQTPARKPLAPSEISITHSIPSSSFYSTPILPSATPSPPSPMPACPASPPSAPPSPSPPSTQMRDVEQHRRDSVEAHLIKNHPQLAGFSFAHRSGLAGQSTTFVDASRRAFASRVECPEGIKGVAEQLEKEVLASTVPVMKSDSSRGAHKIRQIGVHRENGAIKPVYSSAFTTAPTKWLHLMRGTAFSRFRGHVSRT